MKDNLEKGNIVGGILVDFKNAYDSTWKTKFLYKSATKHLSENMI